jgi:excisionase family DNA binding protein
MKKNNHNPNHVKIHRNYTVEEVAELLGTHKNTVLNWVKGGLTAMNDKRPMLILGYELKEYLIERRTKHKKPCKLNELYCMRCRKPQTPAGNMADFTRITEKVGNLEAICPDCQIMMNKRVSIAKLDQIKAKIDITLPQELRHIIKRTKPSVNSDFN